MVTQFFGINPDAYNKVIHIHPQMPSAWGEAKIENVIITDNNISMEFKKEGNEIQIVIAQENGDWEVHLDPSFYKAKSIKLNDTAFDPIEKGTYSSKGKSISFTLTL
jgi:CHAT domain-containing protein